MFRYFCKFWSILDLKLLEEKNIRVKSLTFIGKKGFNLDFGLIRMVIIRKFIKYLLGLEYRIADFNRFFLYFDGETKKKHFVLYIICFCITYHIFLVVTNFWRICEIKFWYPGWVKSVMHPLPFSLFLVLCTCVLVLLYLKNQLILMFLLIPKNKLWFYNVKVDVYFVFSETGKNLNLLDLAGAYYSFHNCYVIKLIC